MEQFIEIIDTYLSNYHLYKSDKIEFECDYGELIFNKEFPDILTLSSIYINPRYRRNGFCKNIIYYLIEKSKDKFRYIMIESVVSKILYNYLLRFKYEDKKFELKHNGFIYKTN
jgi:hypothetical protein